MSYPRTADVLEIIFLKICILIRDTTSRRLIPTPMIVDWHRHLSPQHQAMAGLTATKQ